MSTQHPWDEVYQRQPSTDTEEYSESVDPADSDSLSTSTPTEVLGSDRNESVTTFLNRARLDAEAYERNREEVQAKMGVRLGNEGTNQNDDDDDDDVSVDETKLSPPARPRQIVETERKRTSKGPHDPAEKLSAYHGCSDTPASEEVSSPALARANDIARTEKRNQNRLSQTGKEGSPRDERTNDEGDKSPLLSEEPPTYRRSVASRRPVDPGAVRVYVGNAPEDDGSDNLLTRDSTMMTHNNDEEMTRPTFVSGIDAESENVVKAVAVDDETVTAAEPMKPENKRCRRVVVLSLLATIIILTVLVSVYLTHEPEDASLAPSVSPSQSPSYSTTALEEFIAERAPGGDQFEHGAGSDDSPPQKAFDWLAEDPYLRLYSDDRILQRYALATLYYHLSGDGWLNSENWLSYNISECSWYSTAGEACNKDEKIVSLELTSNSLQGSIPAAVALLTDLEKLDLSQNQISGTIPTHISGCALLQSIDLSSNNLFGEIPTEFAFMNNLSSIVLNENSLSGYIPLELGSMQQLTALQLASNAMLGPIPGELFLSDPPSWLQFLDLSNNDFTGELPTEIGHATSLVDLNIQSNAFVSSLPTEMGLLTLLTSFRASSCGLEGGVPSRVSGFQRLQYMDVSDNALIGFIPASIGNVTKLSHMDLSRNSLTSTVPAQIMALRRLQYLDLSHNFFTGTLFEQDRVGNNTNMTFGQSMSNLRYLDLGSNRFSGAFIRDLGNMSELRVLRFVDSGFGSVSDTQGWGSLSNLEELDVGFSFKVEFDLSALERLTRLRKFRLQLPESETGGKLVPTPLPTGLGRLTRLESFALDGVSISSCIPSTLGQLTRLRDLQLAGVLMWSNCSLPSEFALLRQLTNLQIPNNKMVGTIPPSIANMGNLNAFNMAGNFVSGPMPSTMGSLLRLTSLDLSGNQITGTIPSELSKLPFLDALLLHDNPTLSGTFPSETFAVVTSIYNTNVTGTMPELYCRHLKQTRCSPLPTADAKLIGDCFRPSFTCTCCTSCCAEGNCTENLSLEVGRCDDRPTTPYPTVTASLSPSAAPSSSSKPSLFPSISMGPSLSTSPSHSPSYVPSLHPSLSTSPSHSPSYMPSLYPSISTSPSVSPSYMPSLHPSLSVSPSRSPSYAPSAFPSVFVPPTVPPAPITDLTLTIDLGRDPDALRLQLDKMLNATTGESHVLLEPLYRLPPRSLDTAGTQIQETIQLKREASSSMPELEYYRLLLSDAAGEGLRKISLSFSAEGGAMTAGPYEYGPPFGSRFIVNFDLDDSEDGLVVGLSPTTPAPSEAPDGTLPPRGSVGLSPTTGPRDVLLPRDSGELPPTAWPSETLPPRDSDELPPTAWPSETLPPRDPDELPPTAWPSQTLPPPTAAPTETPTETLPPPTAAPTAAPTEAPTEAPSETIPPRHSDDVKR